MSPILAAIIVQMLLGRKDAEIIQDLNASERAQLEQAFGGATSAVAEARRLTQNIPQLNLGDFAAQQPLGSGSSATVNIPGEGGGQIGGTISTGEGGELFLNVPNFSQPVPLSQDAEGRYFVTSRGQNVFVEPTVDEGQIFRNIFEGLRSGIPNLPSSFQSANIPTADPFGDLEGFAERLGDIGGGFLRRGDLGRISTESLLPDLPDPEAFRAQEESELLARTGAAAESERVGARRSLGEAGILPGSAAFQFESEQAPELRRTQAVGEGLPTIESQTQDLISRNAAIESQAAQTAAQLNTQLAGIETGAINQQLATIGQNILGAGGLNLESQALRLDAARQDANNAFASFAAQRGISQDQIDFFNQQIGLNASLSSGAAQLGAQVAMAIIQAELEDSPNVILDSDRFRDAVNQGLQVANLLNIVSPPDQGGGTPLGFGFNFNT